MAAFRWARDTLAQHILGGLNTDRSAPGGTVPDRLANLVNLAYYRIWEASDWRFKKLLATLTFPLDDDDVDLPSDFDKLDMQWLKENNRNGIVRFTEDTQLFESQRRFPNETSGQPRLVIIEPKPGLANTFLWQARCVPPPNKAYNYPYIYLRNAPDLAATTTFPVWPDKFDRGWELRATAMAARLFIRDKSWVGLNALYDEWLQNAIEQDDETMVSSTPHIRDTQGDVASLASQSDRDIYWGASIGP